MAKVCTTKNHRMFQPHSLQREIREGTQRYLELEASLLKYGMWKSNPIIVYPSDRNGIHTIARGHHRWKIAQKHKIPVHYLIDEDRVPITAAENSGGRPLWSMSDWVTSHLKDGKNPNYRILQSFHERTGIPVSLCIKLFLTSRPGWGGDWNKEVKDGSLRIVDTGFAESIGDLVTFCYSIGVGYAKKTGFVRALALIVRTKVADCETLKKRIRQNIGLLKRKTYNNDYLAILNDVYNHRNYPKIDFRTEINNALADERRKLLAKNVNDKRKKKDDEKGKAKPKQGTRDSMLLPTLSPPVG